MIYGSYTYSYHPTVADYGPDAKFVTLKEASFMLGLSPKNKNSNLSALCRSGKVPGAWKAGHVWMIPWSWVEARKFNKQNLTI